MAQTLKWRRFSLNGEVANKTSVMRRASASNFFASAGGVTIAENQKIDFLFRLAGFLNGDELARAQRVSNDR